MDQNHFPFFLLYFSPHFTIGLSGDEHLGAYHEETPLRKSWCPLEIHLIDGEERPRLFGGKIADFDSKCFSLSNIKFSLRKISFQNRFNVTVRTDGQSHRHKTVLTFCMSPKEHKKMCGRKNSPRPKNTKLLDISIKRLVRYGQTQQRCSLPAFPQEMGSSCQDLAAATNSKED